MTDFELLEEAKKARLQSYCPYSGFAVGAALQTKDGKVYHGCNIENAGYTPSNCGERTAFFKAVYDGHREFEKIAVVGAPKGQEPIEMTAPCGVCRQIMMEFCDPKTFKIIMPDGIDNIKVLTLEELLPYGFGPKDLA